MIACRLPRVAGGASSCRGARSGWPRSAPNAAGSPLSARSTWSRSCTCPGPARGRVGIGHIGNAFVLASFADRGVPAALLSAVVEHARERRYRSLLLAPTAGSSAFYRRAGFAPAGKSLLAMEP